MNTNNLIRIDDLDQEVFRIDKIDRIEQMFSDNMLVLVRPAMWEDPFENFLLKCSAVEPDGTIVALDNLANSWYGSCWTLNSDSDAMWRIYSQKKDGIRLKSTVRKLAEAIWETQNLFSSLKYFIGKVQYLPRTDIEKILQRTSFWNLAAGGQNSAFAETLLLKRTEFEHENEIRILACSSNDPLDPRTNGDLYKIPINSNYFIEELCIDPRLSDAEAETVKNKLQRFGYSGQITQSELYKLKITQIKIA
jgi:hypothetical protein